MGQNPITGCLYFLEGFRLISKPALRSFVLIPLAINMILFIVMFFVARHYVHLFNFWFASHLPAWLHWLSIVLWLIFFLIFFLVFTYSFVTFANLISAPFNSFLAEKVELYLTGKVQEPRTLWDNLKDIPRIIGRQCHILGYYLPRAGLLLILLFIPVVQAAAVFLGFLFHAWFIAMTYIDYPTDNHHIPIQAVRQWLDKRRWFAYGFGGCVLMATMIPILNLFTIPAAVAGATKWWLDEQLLETSPEKAHSV